MNTMMLALLQGRLWDTAATLQERLQGLPPSREFSALERWDVPEGASADVMEGMLAQVQHALQRVHAGRYGYCDDCERALELDQLLLHPYKLRCPDCQGDAGAHRHDHALAALSAVHGAAAADGAPSRL